MAKVKSVSRKTSLKNAVIIDQLAKFLSYSGKPDELPKKVQKLYSNGGVVLKQFSKRNNFNFYHVEKTIKANLFFELSTARIIDSVIFKQPKELSVARFTDLDKIKRLYRSNRERMLEDASGSGVLISRLMRAAELRAFGDDSPGKFRRPKEVDFIRPKWTAENIYSTYLPDEFENYRKESKAQSNYEKRFNSKLDASESFRFSNDLVASSLMSWFQSLLISDAEIVREHLLSGDFEHWLRQSASERELANICSNLTRQFEETRPSSIVIKREMLKRLRRTSYESSIYNSITKPLLRKLKSPEPVTVQETAIKLMELGDEKTVDGLIETLFESMPETRKVVMEALGVIGDPRAIPPMVKIIEHSRDPRDNIIALWTLSKFDDDRARKMIEKIARENNGKLSERAKQIMKNWESS